MVERRSVYSGAEPDLLCTHAVTGGGGGNAREDWEVLRKEACEKFGPTTCRY